ncbi:MAG: YqhA family protein [Pseudomonadota bacterium]
MLDLVEKKIFRAVQLSTLVAILASWLGAVLMFVLGSITTLDAVFILAFSAEAGGDELPRDEATVVYLIEALDRFLIAVVLIYFGFGLYGLFIRPGQSPREMGLPDWLHVDSIGELKQTVAEVIIVILFVLFLSVALKTFHRDLDDISQADALRLLLLPAAILLLSAALRLAELHPKKPSAGAGAPPAAAPTHAPGHGPPHGPTHGPGHGARDGRPEPEERPARDA